MNSKIHFEQFVEEIRKQHPQSKTICATENPLQVFIDGQPYDPHPLLSIHQPFCIQASPTVITADGVDFATIKIEAPDFSGDEITLAIQQGGTVLHEAIQLDGNGSGELEICSQTAGQVIISHPLLPVRASFTCLAK